MRRSPRGSRRSVGRGACRPAIEPRKGDSPGCRRRYCDGRPYERVRQRERPPTRRGQRPRHARTLLAREPGDLPSDRSLSSRSAPGRRGAVAGDARTGEVRPRHSSEEAGEQGWATSGGAGGAKGGGRGERGPAKHAPGSEPGKRVPGAGPRTANLPSTTQGGSRMRECRTYGSVRGAPSNGRPYRDSHLLPEE